MQCSHAILDFILTTFQLYCYRMSNIRTSLPIPTQPWESGKAKFLEGLSQQQAAQFRDATAENLFYDASVAQKRHANNSRSWLLQERLSSLVNAIDDYGKALDVYSNTYGLVISPLWGSLRIILHIAGEAGKFQESLTDMLAQIGDVLPRFRIYQILFSNHERLLVALSSAFLDVLGFCITTKEFFTRAKRSKIPLSIVLKGAWKPYRQDFDGYMNKFRKHSKKVEKEAGIAHFIESARSREVQRANRELQLRNGKLHRRHQILSAIPTSSYWSMQSKMSNLRHPKSNKWIQDTPEYLSWYSSLGSDCLCCYGIPGSGKSVLAASLVDDLLACAAGPRTLVIYYYCDFAENSSLEPICLLSSLIKQVLERVPLDQFTDSFDCPLKEGKPAPNLQKTLDYLADLIKIFDRAYIILDGLDQLTTDGQTVVLDIIQNLLYNATIISKIFVTSRLEEYIIKRSLKSHKTIQLSNGCTQDDMELFITESITSTLIPQNPLLKDARLREDVIKALLKGANGMYLWVKFQLYDIAHVMTEHVMRTTIQNLPKNLSKTYARILENVRLSPGGSVKLETMQKVFRWVAGARRPLTLTELEEAVGLEKTDKYLHLDRIATGAGERLIASCSNLVVLNEADYTVSFAHHTVQQFLCSSAGPANLWPHFNLQSINEHIADICLAYLSFSDFETQLTKVSEVKLEQTQAELLVWWGVPLATSIKGLLTLPRALRKAAINKNPHGQIKFPAPVTMQPSDTLATKYAMLDYIIAFWAFHTADITPESSSWPVFKHIASEKQLAFGFRPWDEPEHCDRVQQLRLKKTKENDGGGAQNSLSWRLYE
ncbi:hypothetical protein BKA66DRAFT_241811 [Pyrenochaeta sp. MPI-SDFR-AT-0127]|nr:hypothetical protein BKA66DRAFT_241811 [Pyrenochaeta sp. MPI-SDFR-AT-0127]